MLFVAFKNHLNLPNFSKIFKTTTTMENKIKSLEKEFYTTPDIEVIKIETEQNVLQSGSSDNAPNMDRHRY